MAYPGGRWEAWELSTLTEKSSLWLIFKNYLSCADNKCIQTFSRVCYSLEYSLEILHSLYLGPCLPSLLLVTQWPLETPPKTKTSFPRERKFIRGRERILQTFCNLWPSLFLYITHKCRQTQWAIGVLCEAGMETVTSIRRVLWNNASER